MNGKLKIVLQILIFLFQNNIDEDAKDLILKLMAKNPLERLGASYSNKKFSMAELKKHKFFKGNNFKTKNLTPPFNEEELKLLQKFQPKNTPIIE